MRHPRFRRGAMPALLISASALGACATTSAQTPVSAPLAEIAATPTPEPLRAVEVVTIPEPLPLPGQLKPVTASARMSEPVDPRSRVGAANAAARVQPVRDGFLNAIQQYPWADGALYQVYAAPGQVTDIALQEGEQLVGAGPVAAGDTVRWIIGDTMSGSGTTARVHILVKLPAAVHRDLVAYAAALAAETGGPPAAPEKLVAPMLARFMETDRAFRRHRAQGN